MTENAIRAIQNVMNEMTDNKAVAGVSCLVIKDGAEKFYYQSGNRNIEKNLPMERDTIVHLFSMTKPITACAVMKLMEEGLIDLAEPVSKFLPGFKNQTVGEERIPVVREVTIKDLLTMTGGLTYEGYGTYTERKTAELLERLKTDTEWTTYEVANAIGEIPLNFQPGTDWQYSVGADVLGAVIEVVTGQSLGKYLRENIFEPLGMKDTAFWVPADKQSRLSAIYDMTGEGLIKYTGRNLGISPEAEYEPAFEAGGAGLVSTIDDYARFATMLLQGGEYNGRRILGENTVRFFTGAHLNKEQQAGMYRWQGLEGYSYGNLMRVRTDSGLACMNGEVGEYGWDGWAGTYFCNDPVNKLTMIVFQQLSCSGTTTYTRKIKNIVYRDI